jgi:hypothetical protein
VPPERRPSHRRRVQQIVCADPRQWVSEVPLDLREDRAEKSEPLG